MPRMLISKSALVLERTNGICQSMLAGERDRVDRRLHLVTDGMPNAAITKILSRS